MLRQLVKKKNLVYILLRMFKDSDSDQYEVILSSTTYPYWKRRLLTVDRLAAEEKYNVWRNHSYILQLFPAKLTYNIMI